MANDPKVFDAAAFFSKVEVELVLQPGQHEATFIKWEPSTAGINLLFNVSGQLYKSYQTSSMLNITLKDMERQANTGLINPLAFLDAIKGMIFTIHAAETTKAGKTYHNINWRPLPIASETTAPTDEPELEVEDLN